MTIIVRPPDEINPVDGIGKLFKGFESLRQSQRPQLADWEIHDRIRERGQLVTKLHGVIARRTAWEDAVDVNALGGYAAVENGVLAGGNYFDKHDEDILKRIRNWPKSKISQYKKAGLILEVCEQGLSNEALERLVTTYSPRFIVDCLCVKTQDKWLGLLSSLLSGELTGKELQAQVCTDEAVKEVSGQISLGKTALTEAEAAREAARAAAKAQGLNPTDTAAYKEANQKVQDAKRSVKSLESKLTKLDQEREDRRAALIERIKELEQRVQERNAFIADRDRRVNEERCRRYQHIKSLQDFIAKVHYEPPGEDEDMIKGCALRARILNSQLLTYRSNIHHFLDFHEHYQPETRETLDRLNQELYDLLTPRYGNHS